MTLKKQNFSKITKTFSGFLKDFILTTVYGWDEFESSTFFMTLHSIALQP